jgi:hypothetical protein
MTNLAMGFQSHENDISQKHEQKDLSTIYNLRIPIIKLEKKSKNWNARTPVFRHTSPPILFQSAVFLMNYVGTRQLGTETKRLSIGHSAQSARLQNGNHKDSQFSCAFRIQLPINRSNRTSSPSNQLGSFG